MAPGADLSLPGIARLAAEFLDRLDLRDVTLVGNDTGGALVQLLMGDGNARVGRAVLVSCDAFDNFPPGLTGKTLVLSGKLPPPLFGLFMQQMRLRAVRRLPIAFGWLTKRGDAATARWMRPVLTRPGIRRDAVRMLRAAAADTGFLLAAAERLPGFDRPALVVWASRDRVMPPEHGRRLAGLLPQGRLTEVDDSYTLIPLDQPARLAQAIRDFGDELETGPSRHETRGLDWIDDLPPELAGRPRQPGPSSRDKTPRIRGARSTQSPTPRQLRRLMRAPSGNDAGYFRTYPNDMDAASRLIAGRHRGHDSFRLQWVRMMP